ncbi:DUF2231 domain-containing protein [Nocardioides sp.]|uniref:DUF2231 domain-containing protein n=1 Tax=Nocardioides sp. TaxID=35761 RepID=UPI003564D4A3
MELNGVPLHPLVVHAAVVFVPLAALGALVLALVPRWRWAVRTPTLVLAVVAALSAQLAAFSGEDFMHRLSAHTELVDTHQMWGDRLVIAMWVLAALTAAGWWLLPFTSPLPGRPERASRVPVLVLPMVLGLPVVAIAVLGLVVLTGDAGARSAWGGQ